MVNVDGTNTTELAITHENHSAISTIHPGLPELSWSIRDHKWNIIVIWTLFTLDSAIFPLLLFYALWYHTSESSTDILTITTCVFGVFASVEWGLRTFRLWKREDVRPVGGQRIGFDFFHYSYSIGYCIGIIELIVGTIPDVPFIRLCAMPAPSFITYFGLILLTTSFLSAYSVRAPFRISSIPKGAPVRPTVYTIIEDVIGVGTGTGRPYRQALNARYETSPRFRRMLAQVNLFWGLSAVLVGVGVTLAMYVPHTPRTIGYGLGWAVPAVWAMIWAALTTVWVQRCLRKEKAEWGKVDVV